MVKNIIDEQGIHLLDNYDISKKIHKDLADHYPKSIKNIFSKKPFVDVNTGTYILYLNGYELEFGNYFSRVTELLDFIEKYNCTVGYNLLLTLITNSKNANINIVLLPMPRDEVRFVIYDRAIPNHTSRDTRFWDPQLVNSDIVLDVIMPKNDLILQFYQTFNDIYEENKHCLSDEYKKELAEAKKGLYQEYILDDIKKILDKLECFYNNRELYIKNTTFDVATWDAKTFTNPHELKEFFVKSEFIGGTLEDIQILGQVFYEADTMYDYYDGKWYCFDDNDEYTEMPEGDVDFIKPDCVEDAFLTLDEPIALFIKNDDEVKHFDIDFTKTSSLKMAVNDFTFLEESYHTTRIEWKAVSKYFSKNLIGHKIVDVDIKTFEDENSNGMYPKDSYELVKIVFDNGYKLCLATDYFTGYLELFEEKPNAED